MSRGRPTLTESKSTIVFYLPAHERPKRKHIPACVDSPALDRAPNREPETRASQRRRSPEAGTARSHTFRNWRESPGLAGVSISYHRAECPERIEPPRSVARAGTSGIGASRPLRSVPTKVRLLNRLLTLDLRE